VSLTGGDGAASSVARATSGAPTAAGAVGPGAVASGAQLTGEGVPSAANGLDAGAPNLPSVARKRKADVMYEAEPGECF